MPVPYVSPFICVYQGHGQLCVKRWCKSSLSPMSSDSQCISGLIVIVIPTAIPAMAHTGHPFFWVPHPSQLLYDLETRQAFPPDFCAVLTSKTHIYILMVLSFNSIINPGADGPCGCLCVWWEGCVVWGLLPTYTREATSSIIRCLASSSDGWGLWSQTNRCLNPSSIIHWLCDLS